MCTMQIFLSAETLLNLYKLLQTVWMIGWNCGVTRLQEIVRDPGFEWYLCVHCLIREQIVCLLVVWKFQKALDYIYWKAVINLHFFFNQDHECHDLTTLRVLKCWLNKILGFLSRWWWNIDMCIQFVCEI